AERVRLEEGSHSFHVLALRWTQMALGGCEVGPAPRAATAPAPTATSDCTRRLVQRFFEMLEANAESYWDAPQLESTPASRRLADEVPPLADPESTPDDGDDDLYRAAYDEMVYRDSTADGVEGSILESGGHPSDYEVEEEANRLASRLAFLTTLGR